jgi:hypothetical protein
VARFGGSLSSARDRGGVSVEDPSDQPTDTPTRSGLPKLDSQRLRTNSVVAFAARSGS